MMRTGRRAVIGALLMVSAPAAARDDVETYPLADVFNNPEYAQRLEGAVVKLK